jgi:hypothetical protein
MRPARRHVLGLTASIGLLACAPLVRAARDPLTGFRRSVDAMRGLTWYQHPTSPRGVRANAFFLYFGRRDDGTLTPLRLLVRYYSPDWLFVRRAWTRVNGVALDIPDAQWQRDHADGDIWEWSDAPMLSRDAIATVQLIAQAKAVTVRFEGRQYYDDRKLSASQLKALRETIAAYEAVSGKTWGASG